MQHFRIGICHKIGLAVEQLAADLSPLPILKDLWATILTL